MKALAEKECTTGNVDVILDKGLLDALLCGEGWDTDVERLLTGASELLTTTDGMYQLISYKLASSTKTFLAQIGDQVGIQWDFDIPTLSSPYVSYSIGRRISLG